MRNSNGLSALRLCDWLFDNYSSLLFDMYKCFLLAFGAIKGEVFKHCVRAHFDSGFIVAEWA